MRNLYIYKILKSNYCKLVFLISLIAVTIVIPKKIFYGYYTIMGISFILISSLLITCFVRNAKERVLMAKTQKISFIGILFLLIGLVAMDTCTVGAPVCGASIATGVVAILFPGVALSLLDQYSILIILFSLSIQIVALYYMNCFKKVKINLN